jgi:hypothetical protein
MKLFKSLLVAPATLGLLAPLSATANEVTISDFNPAEELAVTNSRVDGLEARLNNFEAGGFSETTTASFSVDAVLGSIDGDTTSEATTFEYQYNIGLSTSFTGEDSLDVAIDSGSDAATTNDNPMGFDTGAALSVDGVTYSFPVGGVSMVVGNDTDISASFTGACTYAAFTDFMSDCGTGNSIGVGGNGVTATGSYAFDSGFSLAAGLSSVTTGDGILTEEGTDTYGIEAAYTADSYALSLAYVSADNGTGAETTTWGLNGSYTFDGTSLPTISVGFETQETSGTDSDGYFVGLTWPEVGPGSVSVGAGTTGLFADGATETMIYEASYSYPVNDGLTITPGVFIEEVDGGDDLTGILVKSSFAF